MSDSKSKFPDLKELGEMTSKLFNDIKTSVNEIVETYKQKHPSEEKTKAKAPSTTKKEKATTKEKKPK